MNTDEKDGSPLVRQSVIFDPSNPASIADAFAFFREHIDELYRQTGMLRDEQYAASFLHGAVAALQVLGQKDAIRALDKTFAEVLPTAKAPGIFALVFASILDGWTDPPPGAERPPEEISAQIIAFAKRRVA